MTSSIQDHFHLYAETTTFTGDEGHYWMVFQNHQFKVDAAVSAKRGMTGKLLINELIVDGNPVQFRDASFVVFATQSDLAGLELLNGVECYYIPLIHASGTSHNDDDAYKVLVTIVGKQMLDPFGTYYLVQVQLQENTL